MTLAEQRYHRLCALIADGAKRYGEPSDSLVGEIAAARIRRLVRREFKTMASSVIDGAINRRARVCSGEPMGWGYP